ncbi:hypothetical protein QTG54_002191 [Skeletonema marinoi]|uniref:Rad60/SUMO-like domain-containing protein n=1 Tax=Skeletonema marinoi TaxID=267567 RepID=A0AAD9DGZ8_9STRA|nr:hypothetical protein QTG54_002191 [Skeletonema marinoi]
MVNTRTAKRKSSSSKTKDANLADAKRSLRDISDDEAVGSDHPLILVPSRENDFNMKTWWMVDLAPVEESSLQGASALVKRCMRIHGWDETKARKVLASYRQFIMLKKNIQDWNAKILSPCYVLPDYVAKQKRDDTTRASLEEHFGSYDEEIWDYSPDEASEIVNDVANQSEGAANDEESGPPFSDDTKITLRLKGQSGEEHMFKLLRTTPMRKMFNAYAAREGVDVASLRFTLGGELISYDDTPAILELEDLDQIDVAYQQLGC